MVNGGNFLQKYGIHFRYRKLNTMDYGHPERVFFQKLLTFGLRHTFLFYFSKLKPRLLTRIHLPIFFLISVQSCNHTIQKLHCSSKVLLKYSIHSIYRAAQSKVTQWCPSAQCMETLLIPVVCAYCDDVEGGACAFLTSNSRIWTSTNNYV